VIISKSVQVDKKRIVVGVMFVSDRESRILNLQFILAQQLGKSKFTNDI